MADDNGSSSDLPNHIDHTIRSIAIIHAEHSQNATSAQLAVDRITAVVGRPWFIGALTAIVTSWIGLNLFALTLGHRPLDPSPFPWLGGGGLFGVTLYGRLSSGHPAP